MPIVLLTETYDLTDATAASTTYVLQPGTYEIDGPVVVGSGSSLVGTDGVIVSYNPILANSGQPAFRIAANNASIANLDIIFASPSPNDEAAVEIGNANYASAVSLRITNFPAGVELIGPSGSGTSKGNRIERVSMAACGDGVRFDKQEALLIREIVETAPQGGVGSAFLKGGANNLDVVISACSTAGRTAAVPYLFPSGQLTLTGLQSNRSKGLISLSGGASAIVSDLRLIDSEPGSTGVLFDGCQSVTLDGAFMTLRTTSGSFTAIRFQNMQTSYPRVARDVRLKFRVGNTAVSPFVCNLADHVAFLGCIVEVTDAGGPLSNYMFAFEGSDYGYVAAPSTVGPFGLNIVNCITSGLTTTDSVTAIICRERITGATATSAPVFAGTGTNVGTIYSGDFSIAPDDTIRFMISAAASGDAEFRLPNGDYLPPELRHTVQITSAPGSGKIKVGENGIVDFYAILSALGDRIELSYRNAAWTVTNHDIAAVFQPITATGTYSKLPLARRLDISAIGGGGSGASGGGSPSAAGGGGAAGAFVSRSFPASAVPSSLTVTVGAGGTLVTGGSTAANGNAGGETTFGSLLRAAGGPGGLAAGGGGVADPTRTTNGVVGSGGASGSPGGIGGAGQAGGGGGGGATGQNGGDGGQGSSASASPLAGGAGGMSGAGANGAPTTSNLQVGGSGAGGGRGVGGAGGTGGGPGGGGGGGGANSSGSGGAGGAGALGRAWVVTYF